jgi:Fe-S cluster assembly protein SufD
LEPDALRQFPLFELPAIRLVFVNGHFAPALSSGGPVPEGALITSLSQALESNSPALEKHLARYASQEKQPFTALNTAFFQDGALIWLPKDLDLGTAGSFDSTFPRPKNRAQLTTQRNLVIAGPWQSRGTCWRVTTAPSPRLAFTNTVTELVAGDDVNLEHCKFQDESLASFHIAALHAEVGRNSNVIWHSISTGARLPAITT